MTQTAYVGAAIFDGFNLHENHALLLDKGNFVGIISSKAVPQDATHVSLNGGTLLPGFVDLQVNGGGGVMFNDETNAMGIATIARAHAATGTAALLPTLITDTPAKTHAAVDAVESAIAAGVKGILGVHLEGPHISIARKGAHDPKLIRSMSDQDLSFLCDAAHRLPNVMVTVAPENVTSKQIENLSAAGVVVSLGHTDCTLTEAVDAFEAGARCVTHLFNAMSQLNSREPGLVGATLATRGISAGLIADNIHVHPSSMKIALEAKKASGGLFLVTDAMASVGSNITEFILNGRKVLRRDGKLTLEDGTLAGADLDFPTALAVLINGVGAPVQTAFSMATASPAATIRDAKGYGQFYVGKPANAIHLDTSYRFLGALNDPA